MNAAPFIAFALACTAACASAADPLPAAQGSATRPADGTHAQSWVRRQQQVVAESRVGDVLIESAALALTDGREGDVIQVRLSGGGPIRTGRVTAPGRVSL
jgi:hypothetical protein